MELPKSWFKHFYVFAFAWTWLAVYLAVDVYILGNRPHQFVLSFLDLSCGADRSAESKLTKTINKPYNLHICFSFSLTFLNIDGIGINDHSNNKTFY